MAAEKATAARVSGHFTLAADTVVAVGRRIVAGAEAGLSETEITEMRARLVVLEEGEPA